MIYTEKAVSPKWTVNKADLIKIARDMAIFFTAPVLMYFGQLNGSLNQHGVLHIKDFYPTLITIGAIQGWVISAIINFLLKLTDSKK